MTTSLNISTHAKLKGIYQIQVKKADSGLVVKNTEPFDNLILYQGLDHIGNPPVFNTPSGSPYLNTHCGVGTGTTAPSLTDVALEAPLAMYPTLAGSNVEGGAISYVAGTPAYYRCVWTYTFPAGTATGNLSEVGVGGTLNGDTTPRLFSRALIVDGGGVPTTITVLADETLTVTYELRLYIDQTDNTYSFFINTTSYSGTVRRSDIATAAQIYRSCQIGPSGSLHLSTTNGTIGSITGSPSGTSTQGAITQSSYVAGTYFRDFRATFSTTISNYNISALQTTSPHGSWQFSVSPAIPKTLGISLQLNWRQSWGFYP